MAAGQIRAFTGNEYIQDLAAGNIVACEAWSGDVIQAQFDNPDIKFVAPEEGLMLWSDNMLVPNLAQHQANAETWMNYYYQPDVAAKLAAWVNYICPVQGAQQEMEKIDPDPGRQPADLPRRRDARRRPWTSWRSTKPRSPSTKETAPMSQVAEAPASEEPTGWRTRRRTTGSRCAS